MTMNDPTPANTPPSSRWKRTLPIVRLILAWLLTLGVLLYAWARVLVMWKMIGSPEAVFLGGLAAGLVAVAVLTAGVSSAFVRPRTHWLVALAVAVPWLLGNGVLVALAAGPLLAWPYVVLLFVPATLWVVWAGWMCYFPWRWRTRLAVLGLLLAALAGSTLLLQVEGLTGDAHVNFAWRFGADEDLGEEEADEEAPGLKGAVKLAGGGRNDFSQFLGPRRLGVLPGPRLAGDWEKRRPRLVWRRKVGAGWSGFAVAGAYAVTQEQRGERECVTCYRVADGKRVWTHADPVHFDTSLGGPGPRATPTIAGGRVYTVGATGLLNCLDGGTGRALWSADILKDSGAGNIAHGVCGSPLLVGRLVVVCPTGRGGPSLVAYHQDTGKPVWRGGTDQASYGSPLLAELAGVPQILLYNAAGVAGHDPKTGKVLWRFPWTNRERTNCSQPIPNAGRPGRVFVGTGYGTGSALFRVRRSGRDTWSVDRLWTSRRMQAKFTTPVLFRGHVYGLDNGILECLDLQTGKSLWKDGRYEHGQVLLVGGLLLIQAEKGAVVLVRPAPDGLHELARWQALTGKTWNNPALAGRFLLVRNSREAACFELPLEGEVKRIHR
jgi:outer membrane protein assembly factor BamB